MGWRNGDVIRKAADGVGGLLEKAFLAPFKTTFGGSCEILRGQTAIIIAIDVDAKFETLNNDTIQQKAEVNQQEKKGQAAELFLPIK
ncbi:unnamed protein product [Prunus armeniaca]|uniref:Uncharacterized protein n=1 Tax=Prunus armeniaca TaxID=36596 RepID=A0A6J5Y3R3_PRUAR|nr:unnamed protein product [Prunus armeniaca]